MPVIKIIILNKFSFGTIGQMPLKKLFGPFHINQVTGYRQCPVIQYIL